MLFDHTFIGIWALLEQSGDAHQDATDAVTALSGLFFDEGSQHSLTHRVVHQALSGLNATPFTGPKGGCASILGLIVDQHRASTTLTTTATKPDRFIRARGAQEMQDVPIRVGLGRQARLVQVKGDHRQSGTVKT
jgi:hypothetical protein